MKRRVRRITPIADYTEAIRIYPQHEYAYYNRGVMYHALKQYEQAISDYTEHIRIDPGNEDALHWRDEAIKRLRGR